jgi:hypothetical protein
MAREAMEQWQISKCLDYKGRLAHLEHLERDYQIPPCTPNFQDTLNQAHVYERVLRSVNGSDLKPGHLYIEDKA